MLPKDVKPEDVLHPTGVFFRNPTHTEEADNAKDQSQIVKAIIGAQRERATQVITYTEESKPWILPGFPVIQELEQAEIKQLCRSLMRFRPNIFKVHIKFGDYATSQRVDTNKTRNLSSFEPRFHTEVAEKMAEILADKTLRVTEIVYTVHSAEPGQFRAVGEVFGLVSDKEWENKKLFQPAILIEYFSNR